MNFLKDYYSLEFFNVPNEELKIIILKIVEKL